MQAYIDGRDGRTSDSDIQAHSIYRDSIASRGNNEMKTVYSQMRFYQHDANLARYLLWLSVCTSVCLSVTSRCSIERAKRRQHLPIAQGI